MYNLHFATEIGDVLLIEGFDGNRLTPLFPKPKQQSRTGRTISKIFAIHHLTGKGLYYTPKQHTLTLLPRNSLRVEQDHKREQASDQR